MHHWMTYSSLSYNTIQFKHDYSMYTGAQFVDGGGEGRLKHKLDCLINLHQLAGERWGCVKIATAKFVCMATLICQATNLKIKVYGQLS